MLALTYVALAVVGCGYVIVALVLGHALDGDAGDATAAGFHFPLFSPLTLATFCGSVGALGLLATFGLHLSDPASVGVALPGAMVFTYLATYAAWRLLVSSTGTQAVREGDLVGAPAEVLTPIPQDGMGEVVAMVRGQRHAAPARSVDGSPIGRGGIVSVVRVVGSTLVVQAEVGSVPKS